MFVFFLYILERTECTCNGWLHSVQVYTIYARACFRPLSYILHRSRSEHITHPTRKFKIHTRRGERFDSLRTRILALSCGKKKQVFGSRSRCPEITPTPRLLGHDGIGSSTFASAVNRSQFVRFDGTALHTSDRSPIPARRSKCFGKGLYMICVV